MTRRILLLSGFIIFFSLGFALGMRRGKQASIGKIAAPDQPVPAKSVGAEAPKFRESAEQYTTIPTSLLASIKMSLIDEHRKITPKFMLTAGLTAAQVDLLNQEVAEIDRGLEELRIANTQIASSQKGHAVVAMRALGDQGLALKRRFMDRLGSYIEPSIRKFILPPLDQHIEQQFGYFGAYPEEYVIREVQVSNGTTLFSVNRRVIFNDESSTIETTATYADRNELGKRFPGLTL